jgi:hypothetical protein
MMGQMDNDDGVIKKKKKKNGFIRNSVAEETVEKE